MKIASSAVQMEGTHQSLSVHQSMLITGLRMKRSELEAEQNPTLKDNDNQNDNSSEKKEEPAAVLDLTKRPIEDNNSLTIQAPKQDNTEEEVPDETMSTLKALLQYLKSISKNPKAFEMLEEFIDSQSKMARAMSKSASSTPAFNPAGLAGLSKKQSGDETVMVDRYESFDAESEYTTFSSKGVAHTADGRDISFNIDFEMSRSFMNYTRIDREYKPSLEVRNVCDPLVINVGASVASLSDQKFTFDLDGDGNEDNISMLKESSGFLALDKNNDGVINDGNELFGTKSGDGFRDLAEYDEDGNGWIDENDSVFDKLRIWYKNDDGTDMLIDLKSADVGAINLGKAYTEFSQKNEDTHDLNGIVRSSGIFLRESQGAGTIQHIDFAL